MGAVVKLIVFLVGLLGLVLTGANVAEAFGVDVAGLLGKAGAVGAHLNAAVGIFGGWLAQGTHMIAGPATDAAAKPSLLAQWGPALGAGLVSALLMVGATRN